jgi:glutaredoxin-like protein NrdH
MGCKYTIKRLEKNGTPYRVVMVDEDPEAAALIKSWGFLQAPVVDAGNGDRWTGLQLDRLDALKAAPAVREVHRTAGVEDRTLTEDKG